jgi:hypothetical protein
MNLHEAIKTGNLKFRDYINKAVETGKFNESMFVIDISALDTYEAEKISDFFDRTEVTGRMKEIIRTVVARTKGKDETGILILETVTGGGKSHTLAYLYFLFKKRSLLKIRSDVKDILGEYIDYPEAELVLVDGLNLDERKPLYEQTQLKEFFRNSSAINSIKSIIDAKEKPVIFLVDEIIEYFSKRGDNWISDLSYLRNLAEAVQETSNSLMIVTIPTDVADENKLKQLEEFKYLSRKGTVFHPSEPTIDFINIVKKQLIKEISGDLKNDAKKYLNEYIEKTGKQLDVRKYLDYYPFHPMLIEILTERFPEHELYQRTRASLKILSKIMIDIVKKVNRGEEFNTPYLLPGDIDLNAIKDDISSENIFQKKNLINIITEDINNSDIDLKKLLTVVYLYSLYPHKEKAGITSEKLSIALMNSEIGDKGIEEMLSKFMVENSIYLTQNPENGYYYFLNQPNLDTRIRQHAREISDVGEEIKNILDTFMPKELKEKGALNGNLNLISVVTGNIDMSEFDDKKFNIIFYYSNEANRKNKVEEWIKKNELNGVNFEYRNAWGLIYPKDDVNPDEFEWEVKRLKAIEILQKSETDKDIKKSYNDKKAEIDDKIISKIGMVFNCGYTMREGNIKELEFERETKVEDFLNNIIKIFKMHDKLVLEPDDLKDLKLFFDLILGQKDKISINEAYKQICENTNLIFVPYSVFKDIIIKGVQQKVIELLDISEKIINEPYSQNYYYIAKYEYIKTPSEGTGSQPPKPPEPPVLIGGKPEPVSKITMNSFKIKKIKLNEEKLNEVISDVKAILNKFEYTLHLNKIRGNFSLILGKEQNELEFNFELSPDKIRKVRSFLDSFSQLSNDSKYYFYIIFELELDKNNYEKIRENLKDYDNYIVDRD